MPRWLPPEQWDVAGRLLLGDVQPAVGQSPQLVGLVGDRHQLVQLLFRRFGLEASPPRLEPLDLLRDECLGLLGLRRRTPPRGGQQPVVDASIDTAQLLPVLRDPLSDVSQRHRRRRDSQPGSVVHLRPRVAGAGGPGEGVAAL